MNWFKKHKILTVILVLIVIGIVASIAGGGSKNNKTDTSGNNSNTTETQTAKIGTAVRDGKFEFTVKSIKCGTPSIGEGYSTKTAQGQYCLLDISVKNIGNEAQSLFSSNQYLFNASGQKYSADDTATYIAGGSATTWYNDINPGNGVEGTIVFDIPKDQTPTTTELHDSSFSGGVKVSLQ